MEDKEKNVKFRRGHRSHMKKILKDTDDISSDVWIVESSRT